MSIPDRAASAGGRKGSPAIARAAGAADSAGTSVDPDRTAQQWARATRRADCDALIGAVIDRLRHSVVAPPGPAQAPGESLAAIHAAVLQCADDLGLVRGLLDEPRGDAAATGTFTGA